MEELRKLTQKRKDHIQSLKSNNDKSHEIIASLYSDPSHFVYELLQNADDAGASVITFTLIRNCLEVSHNSKRLFNYADIDSITTVGASTKINDVNAIGKFGAGFKSVFGVTTSPIIHSGKYHFKIVDFIVPEEENPIESDNNTIIILPFNRSDLSNEGGAYQQVAEKLRTLESASLLFLRNIREIQWCTEEDKGHYLADINSEKAHIVSRHNDKNQTKEYLLFKKTIGIEGKQLILAVAYALTSCDNTLKIKPLHDTKLFVFYPTNERTGLKFIVHAPYKTTPSRESIPFSDAQNKILTKELSSLIANSLIKIKEQGYLDVDFLTMLPIDETEDHPIYSSSFQQIKETLLSEKILPTSDGLFGNAADVVLAGEKELVALLDTNDNFKLFGRANWLNANITYNKTKALRDYLIKELNIPEVSMKQFCENINEEFIKHKSDDWLIDFYSSITTNKALYRVGTSYQQRGILREKPIIRLEDGNHIQPEKDSGELQVYLPTEQESEFKTVKRVIAENEKAIEFLKALGIKTLDNVSEIKERIVPKYKERQSGELNKEQYLNDFIKSFQIWSGLDEYKKPEVVDMLKDVCFAGGIDSDGMFVTEKPEHVYLKTEKLESWFEGNKIDGVVFLVSEIQEPKYKDFIDKLGIKDSLKIVSRDEKTYRDPRYIQRVNGFNPNLIIDGLEYSLDNINLFRSTHLWGLLLRDNPKMLYGYTKKKRILSDEFKIGERENSEIIKSLDGKKWLYGKSSNLLVQSISEISIEDLHDDYKKEHDNIDNLIEALGLKLDKVKQFEEENPDYAVISKNEKEEFELYKREKAEKEKATLTDEPWKPDADPNNVSIIKDKQSENIERKDLSGQEAVERTNGEDDIDKENANEKTHKSRNSKEIGDWGEQLAKRYLEKKYPEKLVVWLNANGNIGKGYDFVVRKDGDDIAYYEVKSKLDESPTLFEVSGAQWDWARNLYSNGKGDMYCILLVSNAGTNEAKIREFINPVRMWKAGGIQAHPVNIRL